jgi:serine/threonine-protein kinase
MHTEDKTIHAWPAGPISPASDLLGVLNDRYELRDQIGAGAAGRVFEAYDRQIQRLVAVKIVPLLGSTRTATERLQEFRRETTVASRLGHPGIVTIHDFGHSTEQAWIVMELVIGDTLRAVLDKGHRPSLATTVRLVQELLAALAYAHGRGLVHRDVKPGNILLSASIDDDFGTLRLADFGIAHVGHYMPEPGAMQLGSPSVMAPEQVAGGLVGPQADIWAVGVILYELLTGRRPFTGGFPAIFEQICRAEPATPSSLISGLPTAFDAIVASALAKNAEHRFESARAMEQALLAALPVSASASPQPTQVVPCSEADHHPGRDGGLALQLRISASSESMGNHDSGGHGCRAHRSRRRWNSGQPRCVTSRRGYGPCSRKIG